MQIRYSWLDSLRGLAIFLVVIGHVIQFLYCHDNDGYRKCIDWNIIYSFHMPLFFMISGYSYDICKDRFTIVKRAKQLLVPFAVWALINAIYNDSLYIWRLEYFIISPSNGGLWFLYALFFMSVIYYLIDRISNRGGYKQNICYLLILFSLLFFIENKVGGFYGTKEITYNIIFYAIGAYLHRYDISIHNNYILLTLATISVICGYSKIYYLEMISNLATIQRCMSIVLTIPILLFIYGVWRKARFVEEERSFIKDFSHIGKYTLGIYAIHYYIMLSLPSIQTYSRLSIIITSLGIIMLSVFIIQMINRNKVLRKILL